MNEPTIDERIETLRDEREKRNIHYEPVRWSKDALAIIDELRTKHDDFRQQCADLADDALSIIYELRAENATLKGAMLKGGQHVNEPGVGPMARLKQENRDLEAEIERLKRTMKFQEDQYLAEHGYWGECKYKAENARLKTENENARERIIYHSGGWNDD